MSKTYLLLIIMLLLAACSSDRGTGARLHVAEALMEERPDSALAILREISPEHIRSARNRALHGLLLTQACVKNDVTLPNDSAITEAADYFDATSDRRRNMLARYYLGDRRFEQGKYPEAISSLFAALELARELDDRFWIAMSARGIADIYHENHCVVEELEFVKMELDNFRATGKTTFINHAISDLARANHCNENYSESIRLSQALLDSAATSDDMVLKEKALSLLGLSYLAIDSIDKSFEYYSRLCSLPGATAVDSAYLSALYLRRNSPADAYRIINSLAASPSLPKPVSHWLNYQYYRSLDSLRPALEMMSEISHDTDNSLKEARRQNLIGTLMEYHRYKASVDKAELKASRILSVSVIALALAAIAVIGIIARRRYMSQRIIIEEYIDMIGELQHLLRNTDGHAPSSGTPALSLLEKHFEEINLLCKNFSEDDSPKSRKRLISGVKDFLNSYSPANKEMASELEAYANDRYDSVMTKLRADFPDIKDIDYRFVLYSRLRFSNVSIALFLNESNIMSVYNRRKRLKYKFADFDGPNRSLYLDAITYSSKK